MTHLPDILNFRAFFKLRTNSNTWYTMESKADPEKWVKNHYSNSIFVGTTIIRK
jgi:hypothetical protein